MLTETLAEEGLCYGEIQFCPPAAYAKRADPETDRGSCGRGTSERQQKNTDAGSADFVLYAGGG